MDSQEDRGSVTGWIEALRDGNRLDEATRQLWQRYFARLVALARARLRSARGGPADEEDVALSAFESLCRGVTAGRFAGLDSRDGLWRLLVTMTARKATNQRLRERSLKRGGGRVVGEAALDATNVDGPAGLDDFVGREPTPEFAALMADECRRLFNCLRDDTIRQVALFKMEGYENEEIAERLDCGVRTVERKLEVIRKRWSSELAS
jgi:DNA-directed RNA polymerase specialized sigma24 family protein